MLRITVTTKSGDMIQFTKHSCINSERNRLLDWLERQNIPCLVANASDKQLYIIPIDNIDTISLEEWDELDE